jgi:methionyl-tRNA synthetase
MSNKFYITTPIYYVNASPHIGHSYTNIAADTLARFYRRLLGEENVWFLTGTDEHGQKIQQTADETGISPRDFVDRVVVQFQELWARLDISYNDFIRTTEDRHIRVLEKVLEILYQKGEIYSANYEGWYCTPCETFWSTSQLEAKACPDCRRTVEKISETNFFFRLSKYQDWLIRHIESSPDFIRPVIRRNEVISFLRLNKLNDLCISRPKERLSWGVALPFSTGHVTYVWLDALVNYISAVGDFDSEGTYRSRWWPAELHLIGKDILRQHAVYWPIILRALGIEPPKTILAHGWWMIDDTKMSKSRGNIVSPLEIAAKYGVDVYRYFLLRDVPFGLDGNFSEEAIVRRLNADLANDLGNLVYRTLTMIEKYFHGYIPPKDRLNEPGQAVAKKIKTLPTAVATALSAGSGFNFSLALEDIWGLINVANKYIEETKPWNLARENKTAELKSFIRLLLEVLQEVVCQIYPFMPQTAEAIKEQLGKEEIKKGGPLFPRLELK